MLSFCSSSAILLKGKLTFPDKILLIYCGDTPKRSANPFLFKPLDSIYSTKDKAMLRDQSNQISFSFLHFAFSSKCEMETHSNI